MTNSALLRQAADLLTQDPRRAHELIMEALRRREDPPEALFLLAILAVDHNDPARALALVEDVIKMAPRHMPARALKARALLMMSRSGDARDTAEAAAAMTPGDDFSLNTLGVVLSRTGAHAAAARLFRSAIARAPNHFGYLHNLGMALQFTGDLEGARETFLKVLELEPDHYVAALALVSLGRQTADSDRRVALATAFRDDDPNVARQLHLGHALAKTNEDLGDYPAALDWLTRAKAGRRRTRPYDAQRDRDLYAAAADSLGKGRGMGFDNPTPIFIVGLPRSGTTLLDRILSSHPSVVSAGELPAFPLLVSDLCGAPNARALDAESLRSADAIDLNRLGRDYVARSRKAADAPDAARIIDKTPLNILHAGLIHGALPQARIICLRRHPVDTVLSSYRQLFAEEFVFYDYANDLADAGHYYGLFDRLAAHWRAVLPPDRYTEVAYEDLVADLEGQTRRLLDFVGLEFDPACLNFHDNAAPVDTASSVQVRSPLYSSAIGRWRRYGEELSPLIEALKAEGVEIPGT